MWTKRETPAEAHDDARLSALLREWRGSAPSANFEAKVWAQIRSRPLPQRHGLWLALEAWLLPSPIRLSAVAAALGLVLGVGIALGTPDRRALPAPGALLLADVSITSAYLQVVKGGPR